VRAALGTALLQGLLLASDTGKVSTEVVAFARMMGEQEVKAGGNDMSGLVVLG